ncbi:MAG TPA: hypothetical protein VFE65_25360 [Pseudonocardia sp.]|jgi:hypothetical protein|nr:hypothetical protein [Pseudonocardia sp.]
MTNFEIDCDEVTLNRCENPGNIGEVLARRPAPTSGDATFSIPPGRRQTVCIISWLRGEQLLISERLEFTEAGGEISFGPFPLVVSADEHIANEVRVTTAKGAVT